MPSEVAEADTAAGEHRPAGPRARWGPIAPAWLWPAGLTAAAGALRLYRLGVPDQRHFDEAHYVDDAIALLSRGVEEGFAVHPPLAKWLIAAGMGVWGQNPVGWRVAVALAGTATVLITYLAAMRLLRRRSLAALAGLLVAVDGLALTMSRIAMLDGFVALGTITAFWLLLIDRDRMWAHAPPTAAGSADAPAGGETPRQRPPPGASGWRWVAAVVLGATLAVKWSGVLALGAAGLFVVASELALRRRVTGHALAGWPRLAGHLALVFVAVPAVVYVASYTGWFANYEQTRPGQDRCGQAALDCDAGARQRLTDWASEQLEVWRFHADLDAEHPYTSSPLGWPVLQRPVTHEFQQCLGEGSQQAAGPRRSCPVAPGNVRHVIGLGNPAVWWLALPGYALLAMRMWRRDWRAWAIGGFWLAQYLPWLAQERATLFLYYMTPVVPFIALTLAYGAWRGLALPRVGRWLPVVIAVAAVAALVYWYPVLAGLELSEQAWRQRMWFTSWI